jgi:hypothetical protein
MFFAASCRSGVPALGYTARCSGVPLVDEMPASEPDLPGYNNLVAKHLKETSKISHPTTHSQYRLFAGYTRWVWMTCVRFEDKGVPASPHASLMARGSAKEVAHIGAVIGREFCRLYGWS